MAEPSNITVIGAGMVGTCCALYLQRAGLNVTLLDRKEPGEEASFGNLACIGIASCPPPGAPGIVRKIPAMLLDQDAPLKMRWRYLPKAMPWFMSYIANSRKNRYEANTAARQSLIRQAHEALDPLVADADAEALMNPGGILFTYESEQAFQDAAYGLELRRRHGVEMDVVDGHEARQIEPALSNSIVRAVHIPSLVHTFNPGDLVKSLAQLFKSRGGTFLHRKAVGFEVGPDGVRAIRTPQGEVSTGGVVIAAGVWSRDLARQLGTKVPLEAERGYHAMFHGSGVKINGSILSADRFISITPMNYGVRVGGTAEFAPPDAPPNPHAVAMVRRLGESLIPGLKADPGHKVSEWVGSRPAHPDSKPAIGRAPGQKNAWFAFGHDHLGLTMGAITGKLIAELVCDKSPCVDLTPFSPARFRT